MTWDRERFDLAYQQWDNASQSYRPSYRRARQQASPHWDSLIAAYLVAGASPGRRLLVVGCGFGWTVERLVDLGVDTVGTDTSPWINSAKASEARSDIRDRIRPIDVMSPAVASLGLFDLVVTELVLDSIPEADLPAFLDRLETLVPAPSNVAHYVIPAPPAMPDPLLELRELSRGDWIRQRGSHIWITPNGDGRHRLRLPNGDEVVAPMNTTGGPV